MNTPLFHKITHLDNSDIRQLWAQNPTKCPTKAYGHLPQDSKQVRAMPGWGRQLKMPRGTHGLINTWMATSNWKKQLLLKMTFRFLPADLRLCGPRTKQVILFLHDKHDYRLSELPLAPISDPDTDRSDNIVNSTFPSQWVGTPQHTLPDSLCVHFREAFQRPVLSP